MKVPHDVMAFRRDRARELKDLARFFDSLALGSSHPIFLAANQLENVSYIPQNPNDGLSKSTYWGYDIDDLEFTFHKIPDGLFPKISSSLKLTLGIKMVADFDSKDSFNDPLVHLELNIDASGLLLARELIMSYHLDRHYDQSDDPEFPHPIYHFQFGGHKLDKNNREFGDMLIFDSPRIMHLPMELVLGIDFILSNFFPAEWNKLRDDAHYRSIFKTYQRLFWKPFAHTLASHWQPFESSNIVWDPYKILPQLISDK